MIITVTLLCECMLLIFLKWMGIEERPALLSIVLIGIVTIAYIINTQSNEENRKLSIPFIIAFLLRVVLVIFDIYGRSIYVLPNSGADADMFYYEACAVASGGTSIRGTFVTVVGILMRYIGISRLYTQFLIMLCSMAALHVGEKTLRECSVDDDTRYKVMLLLAVLPNFAILSSIFLRESIVTMLISIAILFYVRWMSRGGLRQIILAILSVFTAMSFHSGVIAVLIAFIPGLILFNRQNNKLSLSFANILSTIILIIFSAFILNRYGDLLLNKISRFDSLEDIANVRDAAHSSYARYVGNSNSIPNMIVYTIPRVIFFLFSPMPFQWRGISDIIAFLFSSMFYLIVMIKTWRYLRSGVETNRSQILLLLIVALSLMIVFSWGVSNTGSAVRHRDKMIILYGVLLGLVNSKQPIWNNEQNTRTSRYIK